MIERTAGTPEDRRWMRRALRLAEQGFTPPNPMVGCILVRNGESVGEGFHPYAGALHAERFALADAGTRAQGATAYVTLEPHGHWSRTPPCTDALIAAGVARVVVATLDSNPKVSGRGVAQLREAGIPVDVGVCEQQARRLNEAFFHFHETGSPFVTLKSAMTLDGKIAAHTGESKWITGDVARAWVHRLRAQSGAVMVGIGTLLADDAQLTARVSGVDLPRQPLRVVVDSSLRTPPDASAVRLASERPDFQPLLIATTDTASAEREAALVRPGVEIVRLPANNGGRVDLTTLLRLLADRSIISVFVEGGGELSAGLLDAGLAHKVLFFVAPKLIGGRNAPTPLEGEGRSRMADAVALKPFRVHRLGADIALESYLT